MSKIKLFRFSAGQSSELQSSASDLEKLSQTLNEPPPRHSPRSCESKEIYHA